MKFVASFKRKLSWPSGYWGTLYLQSICGIFNVPYW